MGDSKYLHPVALTWSQGPQKLKKLKNKLQLYFGSKNKSDGGECEIRDPDCTRGYILIHYKEETAALLGRGTYFAADAIYSANDKYSKPDTNGYKYMYLARVLTGRYCVGNKGMIVPPAKSPSNPTDLYDSATDKISAPSVFVIFNDVQAYPEYLITFTK